jgi:putative flippase GtrA
LVSIITGMGVAALFSWFIKSSRPEYFTTSLALLIIFPVLAAFCLWMAYLIGKKFLFVYQFAKFIMIGAFFALFDLVILNGLMAYFGIKIDQVIKYSIFIAVSFIITTSIKYFVDKYWAFEKKEGGSTHTEFGKFFIVTIISLVLQLGIASYIFAEVMAPAGVPVMIWANIGKILGIAVASIWNFVGYKFIVFKK